MREIRLLIAACLVLLSPWMKAQTESTHLRQGNTLYEEGKFNEAEIEYRKGLEKNKSSYTGLFNLADALYRQEKYKEAAALFDSLSQRDVNPRQLSKAYHNLGNALLKDKAYEESIKAYQNALKLNPQSEESRYNLSYAYKMLKKQQEQQKQQQQEQQKKEQEQKQDPQKQKEKQEEEKKQNLNRQEAEKMLDALERQEKNLRKDQQKKEKKQGTAGSGKDW